MARTWPKELFVNNHMEILDLLESLTAHVEVVDEDGCGGEWEASFRSRAAWAQIILDDVSKEEDIWFRLVRQQPEPEPDTSD